MEPRYCRFLSCSPRPTRAGTCSFSQLRQMCNSAFTCVQVWPNRWSPMTNINTDAPCMLMSQLLFRRVPLPHLLLTRSQTTICTSASHCLQLLIAPISIQSPSISETPPRHHPFSVEGKVDMTKPLAVNELPRMSWMKGTAVPVNCLIKKASKLKSFNEQFITVLVWRVSFLLVGNWNKNASKSNPAAQPIVKQSGNKGRDGSRPLYCCATCRQHQQHSHTLSHNP